MGVYIKGMEMPTSCGLGGVDGCGCPCFCAYNEQCQLLRRRIDTAFIKGTPIPNDCPLVPIPPQWRLISAELLKADFTGNFIEAYPTALVHAMIDDAPTIIPASEEGEA